MSSPNNPSKDSSKPKSVRSSNNASVADTANAGKSNNGGAGAKNQRTPPPNARVIQDSHKTGTVTRDAARAAAKRASGMV